MTIGVLNRVEELADRPVGYRPEDAPDFEKLVELDKIIAECLGVASRNSKKVQEVYNEMIATFGNELAILRKVKTADIAQQFGSRLAQAIEQMRQGQLVVSPGFDGQYGRIKIFSPQEQQRLSLF